MGGSHRAFDTTWLACSRLETVRFAGLVSVVVVDWLPLFQSLREPLNPYTTLGIQTSADNAATTVIMAPIGPAERLGVSPVRSWW